MLHVACCWLHAAVAVAVAWGELQWPCDTSANHMLHYRPIKAQTGLGRGGGGEGPSCDTWMQISLGYFHIHIHIRIRRGRMQCQFWGPSLALNVRKSRVASPQLESCATFCWMYQFLLLFFWFGPNCRRFFRQVSFAVLGPRMPRRQASHSNSNSNIERNQQSDNNDRRRWQVAARLDSVVLAQKKKKNPRTAEKKSSTRVTARLATSLPHRVVELP